MADLTIPPWIPPLPTAEELEGQDDVAAIQENLLPRDAIIRHIYGNQQVGGRPFIEEYEADADRWTVAYHLGWGQLSAINAVYLEGAAAPAGVTVVSYVGTTGQTADSLLVDAFAARGVTYTDTLVVSDEHGTRGQAYVVVQWTGDIFRRPPKCVVDVDGLLVFDINASTTQYSTTPILWARDLITDPRVLNGTTNDTELGLVQTDNEATVSTEPRRSSGLTIARAQSPERWIKTIAGYAGAWIFKEGDDWTAVSDRPRASDRTLTRADLAAIPSSVVEDPIRVPSVVRLRYTDPTPTIWRERSVVKELPGVATNTVPRRETSPNMVGINRRSEAGREAQERLNKLQHRRQIRLELWDDHRDLRIGDVVTLPALDELGSPAGDYRVLDRKISSGGLPELQVTTYDAADYVDTEESESFDGVDPIIGDAAPEDPGILATLGDGLFAYFDLASSDALPNRVIGSSVPDATIGGSPTLGVGPDGTTAAMRFDANTEYVEALSDADCDTWQVGQHSFHIWVFSDSAAGDANARIGTRDNDQYWAVELTQNLAHGSQFFRLEAASQTPAFLDLGADAQGWHLVSVQVDPSTGETELWVDARLRGTGTGYTPTGATRPFVMGVNTEAVPTTSNPFDGRLWGARFYTRHLSRSEIASLWFHPAGMGAVVDALGSANVLTFFYQSAAPSSGMVANDYWVDSDDNRLYRYNGSSWLEIQDDEIAQAIADAAAAQGTADNKIYTFAQAATPVNGDHPEGALEAGDLWVETDNGNLLYRYNGASWIAQGPDWSILTGIPGGIAEIYYQSTAPVGANENDLWIDSDDNQLYRHNGASFVEVQDDDIGQAIADAAGAQGTADNKIYTFAQAAAPVNGDHPEGALETGDLWIETDNNNQLYRWSGSWVAQEQHEADWDLVFGTAKPDDYAAAAGIDGASLVWNGDMMINDAENSRPAGWFIGSTTGAQNIARVAVNNRFVCRIGGDVDDTVWLTHTAIPVTLGRRYKIRIRWRHNAPAGPSTSYVRVAEYDGELGAAQWFLSRDSSLPAYDDLHNVADDREITNISTANPDWEAVEMSTVHGSGVFVNEEAWYTPTPGTKYFCVWIMNWDAVDGTLDVDYLHVFEDSNLAGPDIVPSGVINPNANMGVIDHEHNRPAGYYLSGSTNLDDIGWTEIGGRNVLTIGGNTDTTCDVSCPMFPVKQGRRYRVRVRYRHLGATQRTIRFRMAELDTEPADGDYFIARSGTHPAGIDTDHAVSQSTAIVLANGDDLDDSEAPSTFTTHEAYYTPSTDGNTIYAGLWLSSEGDANDGELQVDFVHIIEDEVDTGALLDAAVDQLKIANFAVARISVAQTASVDISGAGWLTCETVALTLPSNISDSVVMVEVTFSVQTGLSTSATGTSQGLDTFSVRILDEDDAAVDTTQLSGQQIRADVNTTGINHRADGGWSYVALVGSANLNAGVSNTFKFQMDQNHWSLYTSPLALEITMRASLINRAEN